MPDEKKLEPPEAGLGRRPRRPPRGRAHAQGGGGRGGNRGPKQEGEGQWPKK